MEANDMAVMREALEEATERLIRIVGCDHYTFYRNKHHCDFKTTMGECRNKNICETIFKAQAALATSPRNCDVGTADEQAERYHNFAGRYNPCSYKGHERCAEDCPVHIKLTQEGHGELLCQLEWAQMPHAESGGGRFAPCYRKRR